MLEIGAWIQQTMDCNSQKVTAIECEKMRSFYSESVHPLICNSDITASFNSKPDCKSELPDIVFELFKAVKLQENPDLCPRLTKTPVKYSEDGINTFTLDGPPSPKESRRTGLTATQISRYDETSLEKNIHTRDQSADNQKRPPQLLLQKTNSDQKLTAELKFIEGMLGINQSSLSKKPVSVSSKKQQVLSLIAGCRCTSYYQKTQDRGISSF